MIVHLLLAAFATFGHFSLCVAAINRMHSVGVPHWAMRGFNLAWLLYCLGIPALAACWIMATTVLTEASLYAPSVNTLGLIYAGICWTSGLIAILHLVFSKREAATTSRLAANHTTQLDVVRQLGSRPVGTLSTDLASRCPGNEILKLSIHEKIVRLRRLPKQLDGLTITHLSDLHFTGQLTPDFFHYVVRCANELGSDLIAITGDIIDKKKCLPWIGEILGELKSRHGAFFVLGNHDRRVRNSKAVRRALTDTGFTDVGGRWEMIEVQGHGIVIAGNELPWYGPAADMQTCPQSGPGGRPFRIALTHTPDQINWACAHDFDMMLAGHTHGGQFRLPILGPVLSPSRFGVRYAAGTYLCASTLVHVSRGLSGTRPFRFNCTPELARLELRTEDSKSAE